MLTVKQPQNYGYKSVHDLPTPPSASRPSPPLPYQESSYRQPSSIRRSQSPAVQQMSTPHRGLPPPAAMSLPPHQQQPPTSGHHAPAPHHQHQHHHPPPPQPQSSSQPWAPLPAPPPQWQGSEESMRTWLQARTEEEKTKQEEEKTRQETLRLEQRKIEAEMLRESLGRGVPPPMVPLVFAGMATGGVLPQTALDWAQQFMSPSQSHQLQIMAPQGQTSPHHQREHSGHSHPYAPPGPGPGPGPAPYQHQPGSPNRPRAPTSTLPPSHAMPHGTQLPSLNTNVPPGPPPPHQAHPQAPGHPQQQEQSPSIYFHHWQPPGSQQAGGNSARPGTPSGETPRKRKSGPSGEQTRSPPPPSNNPTANRRGHKRQRSDMSWYRSTAQDRAEESDRSVREASPNQPSRERSRSEVGKHSVSSLLSNDPAEEARPQWQAYGPPDRAPRRTPPSEDPRSQGGSSRG